ncbi:MAG: hypothetical protein JKY46_09120 [Robiginitomaculum sp.]|nr:hypothetical protein [Robiginitomaculum sp.]
MFAAVIARDIFLIYAVPIFLAGVSLHPSRDGPDFLAASKIGHFFMHIIGLSLLVFFLVVFVIQPWLKTMEW